ncbi:9109_t:CDS:1, partial [Entrophospora sp. SA101]
MSKIMRENSSHLVMFDGGGSTEDIARIIRQYIEEDPRKASRVINNYLRNREFIVFNNTVPISDPMSIRVGWMNPLDLEKEISKVSKAKLLTA